MSKEKKEKRTVTEVDCALLMMLDEERDKFIEHNRHLIINKPDSSGFVSFVFFDKSGKQRKGVIYSCGKKMGNTEACKLYYKFSRRYKAHLYINLGVAGYFSEINIGDVLFVDRLSTLGENNATNAHLQLKDSPFSASLPPFLPTFSEEFNRTSRKRLDEFRGRLQAHSKFNEEGMSGLLKIKKNDIKSGWCLTVPEVIKGDVKAENSRIPDIRGKGIVVDMEAYYLFDWYKLVKRGEPWRTIKGSQFLIFKSVSDMADKNKAIVEECGSRDLAMANLCDVVCAYLTDLHEFPRETKETIYTYFQDHIRQRSEDPLFSNNSTEGQREAFGNLCRYFMTTDSEENAIPDGDCVASACEYLSAPHKTLLLTGHSGTGKSTFISYVFDAIKQGRTAILVDFSKFNRTSTPTDTQVVYLLERLLAKTEDITAFLDGVNINCKTYDALLNAIKRGTYANLSLCIGDITDAPSDGTEARNPEDFIPSYTEPTKYFFGGLSIFSPELDAMVEDAKRYFDSVNHSSLDKQKILAFIRSSGLSHVDFRLLKMFADYEKQLVKENEDFYGFMDKCCAKKTSRTTISSLYQYIPFTLSRNPELSEEQRKDYRTLSKNSYMRAFLFANCIAEIVTKNDPKVMKELLHSNYLLSNDMNLFLELRLKRDGRKSDSFVRNLLPYLSKSENINLSAQTQLIYNIFQLQNLYSRELEEQRKNLLQEQAQKAERNCVELWSAKKDYYDWSIQYRTLSILMWRGLGENERKRDFLDKYNQLLLEDKDTRRYNLSFHLYYYSQREFTFDQVNMFDTKTVTDEMAFNTYYNLLHFLRPENFEEGKNVQDPFAYMNIITLAHLIEDVLKHSRERFSSLMPLFRETLDRLISMLEEWAQTPAPTPVKPKQLIDLLKDMLQELKTEK